MGSATWLLFLQKVVTEAEEDPEKMLSLHSPTQNPPNRGLSAVKSVKGG